MKNEEVTSAMWDIKNLNVWDNVSWEKANVLVQEIERLHKDLDKLESIPLIMEQGGYSPADRVQRVINRLHGEIAELKGMIDKKDDWWKG